MTLPPVVVFLAGLVVVVVGAEMLLRGASRIAAMLGVRPIVIGLTVVAIGTSMPELAVGITAALEGRASLAVGNIAGTNIVNILLILGISAAIRPLPIELLSLRLDVPVMIASALALLVMAWDGVLSRIDGLVLLVASIGYVVLLVRESRRESARIRSEFAAEYGPDVLLEKPGANTAVWNVTLLLVGMAVTVYGAELLVDGAVRIAIALHVSDAVIGLTIVAIGTSAPELGTTLVATYKDERDVAIGNLIGSSITNILVILGLTCVAAPDGIEVGRELLRFDLPLAATVSILCYPVFRTDRMVSRTEGVLFVVGYVIYLSTLVFVRA